MHAVIMEIFESEYKKSDIQHPVVTGRYLIQTFLGKISTGCISTLHLKELLDYYRTLFFL